MIMMASNSLLDGSSDAGLATSQQASVAALAEWEGRGARGIVAIGRDPSDKSLAV